MAVFSTIIPTRTSTVNVNQRRIGTTISGVLTDYGAPITSSDTVLTALGKIQGELLNTNEVIDGATFTDIFTTTIAVNIYTRPKLLNQQVVQAILDNTILSSTSYTKPYGSDAFTYTDAAPLETGQIFTVFYRAIETAPST